MDIELKVDEQNSRLRVDTLLSKTFDIISRTQAVNLIKTGNILVSGRIIKPGYKVNTGEIITGAFKDSSDNCLKAENIDLDIVFEDEFLIIINKPPGLVVHPGAGNRSGTLVNALLYQCPEIKNADEDNFRPGIVHRLDKNTSGLIVVAKKNSSLKFLKNEFKQRRVVKKYYALVQGVIKDDVGKIILAIGRHPGKRTLMASKSNKLRYAETRWVVKERYKDATLVEALLKTGRTHQIRVHFYETGFPLIGEQVYQFRRFRKKKTSIPRHMLHSAYLMFRHPYSGRKLSFTAPLPEDFKKVMEQLAKN
jgi:23S rRNA pseudouridine1911/1915/1917 synthase